MNISLKKKIACIGVVLLPVIFIIAGCNKHVKTSQQFDFGDFKSQTDLAGQLGKLEHTKQPMDICVIAEKNLLLVIDVQDTTYIKAYNLKTYQFIKAFVKKGPGVNEQLDCHKLQYDTNYKYLYATDLDKQKIYGYSLDDILNPSAVALPVFDISLEDHNLYRPTVVSGDKFVDYSSYKPNEKPSLFSFFNGEGKLLFKKGSFPNTGKKYSPDILKQAFEGWFTVSHDKRNIILTYFNTDYIDLYDTLGNLKKRVQGPEFFEPMVKSVKRFGGTMVVPDQNERFAYSSPRMNDDKLYVLYQGKEVLEEGGYHENKLLSFNNQLIPQVYFRLTQPIFAFDMDWSNKLLYGLTHKFQDNYIVKIKMP